MSEERRLAAILAADMVGYSRLMEADESGTLARQKSHRTQFIDPNITEHKGRIVKTTGDGLLVEFASVVDAVKCAVAIQKKIAESEADVSNDIRIQYRIGINIGDIVIDDDDIFGEGVNVAARIEGLCEPGEVYLSSSAHDQVIGKLGLSFENLGEKSVKNITKPILVYKVKVLSESKDKNSTISDPIDISGKPTIAVLPFVNMSGDPEQDYFSDGITEDIITALTRIRQLFVVARNTTFTYKDQAVDVKAIATDLGARYLLEGSVRKAGNRVRISTQLIDGESGNHLWAEKYDRDLDDIFAVQDEITEAVVSSVEPQLTKSEISRARAARPESLNAWELYLRGTFYINRRSEGDISKAIKQLERAIELDPNFAPAYQELSYAYFMGALRGATEIREMSPKLAIKLAERALRLDRDDDRSHMALARALMFSGRNEEAYQAIQEALKLNPTSALNRNLAGRILIRLGRVEDGMNHAEEALKLSPKDMWISPFLVTIAEAHLVLGNYVSTIEWTDRAMRETNAIWIPAAIKVVALTKQGHLKEAREILEDLSNRFPALTYSNLNQNPWLLNLPNNQDFMEILLAAGLPEN